jgi:hypothetical protein
LKSVQDDLFTFKEEFNKQDRIIAIMKENTTMQDSMIDDMKIKLRELAKDNERLSRDRDAIAQQLSKERERSDVTHEKTRSYQKELRDLEERNNELEKEILILRKDRDHSKKANETDMIRLYSEL